MKSEIKVDVINGRKIAIGGIGTAFYQNGYPIEIAIMDLKEQGINVSYLHIADELYKHGWNLKTILRAFSTGDGYLCDIDLIKKFVSAGMESDIPEYREPLPDGRTYIYGTTGYEAQRKIIFDYLFPSEANAMNFLKDAIMPPPLAS